MGGLLGGGGGKGYVGPLSNYWGGGPLPTPMWDYDHNSVMMMTFRVRLKKTMELTKSSLRFDLKKLRNPDVAGTFQTTTLVGNCTTHQPEE